MKNFSFIRNTKNSIIPLGVSLIIGFTGLIGSNYLKYHNKVVEKEGEISITKIYSPLSYLELTTEKEKPTKIFQKSTLTDNPIIGFELDEKGLVKNMTEDSSLWGKPKFRTSFPEKNSRTNWAGVNQTAQRYVSYFAK